jgi:hypothetical protein
MAESRIHVDAAKTEDSFDEYVRSGMAFYRADFLPISGESYAPALHLTRKFHNGIDFRRVFRELVALYAEQSGGMHGYIEGECIGLDRIFDPQPFNPQAQTPFTISHRSLRPGTFRENELPITMSRNASHPELQASLRQMGFSFLPRIRNRTVWPIYHVAGYDESD